MIDGGNCANIIAKIAFERMSFKAEPHPHSYNVNWVEKTAQSIIRFVRSIFTYLVMMIVFGVMS